MRIRPLLAVVVVAALGPAAPADAAANKRCTAKGAKTVVENRFARVFTTPHGGNEFTTARLFGCLNSTGKRVLLARAEDDEFAMSAEFRKVRLNRRFVAWEHESYDISCKASCPPGYDPTTTTVLARDLRLTRSRGFPGGVKDENLVIGSKGTPAWLQDAHGGQVEVRAGNDVLDTGAIDSLALSGATLSWLRAGEPRTATLR